MLAPSHRPLVMNGMSVAFQIKEEKSAYSVWATYNNYIKSVTTHKTWESHWYTDIWQTSLDDGLKNHLWISSKLTGLPIITVLKGLYPEGLTILWTFSENWRSEIAVRRLGACFKYVVSADLRCETILTYGHPNVLLLHLTLYTLIIHRNKPSIPGSANLGLNWLHGCRHS